MGFRDLLPGNVSECGDTRHLSRSTVPGRAYTGLPVTLTSPRVHRRRENSPSPKGRDVPDCFERGEERRRTLRDQEMRPGVNTSHSLVHVSKEVGLQDRVFSSWKNFRPTPLRPRLHEVVVVTRRRPYPD